jgi:hypothetical protein
MHTCSAASASASYLLKMDAVSQFLQVLSGPSNNVQYVGNVVHFVAVVVVVTRRQDVLGIMRGIMSGSKHWSHSSIFWHTHVPLHLEELLLNVRKFPRLQVINLGNNEEVFGFGMWWPVWKMSDWVHLSPHMGLPPDVNVSGISPPS